jgi:hypothetical protein
MISFTLRPFYPSGRSPLPHLRCPRVRVWMCFRIFMNAVEKRIISVCWKSNIIPRLQDVISNGEHTGLRSGVDIGPLRWQS